MVGEAYARSHDQSSDVMGRELGKCNLGNCWGEKDIQPVR